jgi:hypothetical protein
LSTIAANIRIHTGDFWQPHNRGIGVRRRTPGGKGGAICNTFRWRAN